MLRQILIYTAIIVSLPFMIIFAMISSSLSAIAFVVKTWPEELYQILNNE